MKLPELMSATERRFLPFRCMPYGWARDCLRVFFLGQNKTIATGDSTILIRRFSLGEVAHSLAGSAEAFQSIRFAVSLVTV